MARDRRMHLDIPYAEQSPRQLLDMYLPEDGHGPFPVIVFLHGGSYIGGSRRDGQHYVALTGLDRGYAVVSASYRYLTEAEFPAQIHDVKAAVRWTRVNAGEYGLDGSRIAVWGVSAGGHLAALAGAARDVEALEGRHLGNGDIDSDVQAVISWYGPSNFVALNRHLQEQRRTDMGAELLSRVIEASPELVGSAQPLQYADPGDPPVLLQHGRADRLVPAEQSIEYARGLEGVLGEERVGLTVFAGAGHGGPEFVAAENLELVYGFLARNLGPR